MALPDPAIDPIARYTVDVQIANGASLSGAVDLRRHRIIQIDMPADWDAADLTFQSCPTSGGTFQDLYDDAGSEVTVDAAADRDIALSAEKQLALMGSAYLKLRSGTSASAVAQNAARTITLVVVPV